MGIKTIKKFSEAKIKEKGSVFIGQIYPIKFLDEANKILDDIRKKYYDATHHCYAIKIEEEEPKYSDDGEPSGTAGVRILNAINHFEVTNVILVVIRYFGGTKLGVGPLGKAYYECAKETIESSDIVEVEKYIQAKIEYDYKHSKTVHHFLNKAGAENISNEFNSGPIIFCYIPPEKLDFLKESLMSASNNEINCHFFVENCLYLPSKT